jgi:hypothetical protein
MGRRVCCRCAVPAAGQWAEIGAVSVAVSDDYLFAGDLHSRLKVYAFAVDGGRPEFSL